MPQQLYGTVCAMMADYSVRKKCVEVLPRPYCHPNRARCNVAVGQASRYSGSTTRFRQGSTSSLLDAAWVMEVLVTMSAIWNQYLTVGHINTIL